MTRKEPQFSDDLNKPIAVAEPTDFVRSDISGENARRVTPTPSTRSNSNWLLWLFVVVSLCVSFGMAFFGLEEAGRYKAALTQAESQARELESTIDRLNTMYQDDTKILDCDALSLSPKKRYNLAQAHKYNREK